MLGGYKLFLYEKEQKLKTKLIELLKMLQTYNFCVNSKKCLKKSFDKEILSEKEYNERVKEILSEEEYNERVKEYNERVNEIVEEYDKRVEEYNKECIEQETEPEIKSFRDKIRDFFNNEHNYIFNINKKKLNFNDLIKFTYINDVSKLYLLTDDKDIINDYKYFFTKSEWNEIEKNFNISNFKCMFDIKQKKEKKKINKKRNKITDKREIIQKSLTYEKQEREEQEKEEKQEREEQEREEQEREEQEREERKEEKREREEKEEKEQKKVLKQQRIANKEMIENYINLMYQSNFCNYSIKPEDNNENTIKKREIYCNEEKYNSIQEKLDEINKFLNHNCYKHKINFIQSYHNDDIYDKLYDKLNLEDLFKIVKISLDKDKYQNILPPSIIHDYKGELSKNIEFKFYTLTQSTRVKNIYIEFLLSNNILSKDKWDWIEDTFDINKLYNTFFMYLDTLKKDEDKSNDKKITFDGSKFKRKIIGKYDLKTIEDPNFVEDESFEKTPKFNYNPLLNPSLKSILKIDKSSIPQGILQNISQGGRKRKTNKRKTNRKKRTIIRKRRTNRRR